MCKLSIIIPIYNVEKYLERCINSIINQNTNECEIILVDDGSTDSSSNICDSYSSQYDYIRTIHQINQGLSCARNTGINKAKGDYIWFIDGDDYIANNALHVILSQISSNSDIYIINHINSYQNYYIDYKVSFPHKKKITGIECLKMNGAIQAWVSICKRDLLIQNNIFFTKGIYHEDFEFSIRLYSLAKTVEHINKSLYYYICDRNGSIMNQASSKSAIGYAKSAPLIYNFLLNHQFPYNITSEINKIVAIGITFSILRTKGLPSIELKKVIAFYKQNIDIITYFLKHSTFQHYILGLLLRLNIKLSLFFYNWLKSNKKRP